MSRCPLAVRLDISRSPLARSHAQARAHAPNRRCTARQSLSRAIVVRQTRRTAHALETHERANLCAKLAVLGGARVAELGPGRSDAERDQLALRHEPPLIVG